MTGCSLSSQILNRLQDTGPGLARLTQPAEAVKRCYLAPVGLQDPLGEPRDRDGELVLAVVRKVLHAVIHQRHQRRQLVCRRAQPSLQHSDNLLPEGQSVDRRIIGHGVPSP